ncbi:MAG: CPBP family intramembrane glutamic endopeptidase [Candidatus Aerophobetes bacterium]|nr:CPBP family intramembrane glutamic endopeptidase [Candidatus Aerophobetes bacterium]
MKGNMSPLAKLLRVKYEPSKGNLFPIAAWVGIVIANYVGYHLIENWALQFLVTSIISVFLLGIALPIYWTVRKSKSLSEIGIMRKYLLLSLVLCFLIAAFEYYGTIVKMNIMLPAVDVLAPLVVVAIVAGFFEALFFRGWMQLRFEESFGIMPSIFLSAVFYSLYHIGYPGWIDVETLITLFIVGIVFSAIFRITKNIFIIWPFTIPVGAVYDMLKHETYFPFEAIYGNLVIVFFIICLFVYVRRLKKASAPGV